MNDVANGADAKKEEQKSPFDANPTPPVNTSNNNPTTNATTQKKVGVSLHCDFVRL